MPIIRPHLLAVATLVALAAPGCGSDDHGSAAKPTRTAAHEHYTKDDLKRFAIRSADLPAGYKKTESRSWSAERCLQSANSEHAALTSRFKAWGIEGCTGVTYRRKTHDDERYVDVASGAFAFRDPSSAAQALPVIRKALINSGQTSGDIRIISRHSIAVSGLGDETARGARTRMRVLGESASWFFYFWRTRNVVVFVFTSDFLGDLDEQSTLEIAKRIDYRGAH